MWEAQPLALAVYPTPAFEWSLPSSYPVNYDVRVQPLTGSPPQPGHALSSYVSLSKPHYATSSDQFGKSLSWTTFSFDDTVLSGVLVTVKPTTSWKTCVVAPRHYSIQCSRSADGTTASFVLPSSGLKVSVEFDAASADDPSKIDDVVNDALLIFADQPEDALPSLLDPSVMFFNPGFHNSGCIELDSNTTVYLAGGAWVVGTMMSLQKNNITIRGRGVITLDDQRDESHRACPYPFSDGLGDGKDKPIGLIFLCGGLDLSVEGVAAVATPECTGGHITLNCDYHGCNIDPPPGSRMSVVNAKAMGWSFSADGITAGRRGYVADCFSRTNDDNLHGVLSHSFWERNVVWQLSNGWSFMLQWNTIDKFEPNEGVTNVTFKDVSVIHSEQEDTDIYMQYNPPHHVRSVVGLWQGVGAPSVFSNILLENIHVEGGIWTHFLTVYVGPGPFSEDPGVCCGSGQVFNLTFTNVTLDLAPHGFSWMHGNASQRGLINTVRFNNFEVAGKVAHSATEANLFFDDQTVSNVSFN